MGLDKRKGLALIVCMSVLFGLSSLAVGFVTITSINRRSSSNFVDSMQAKMLAMSSIDVAIARIISGYETDKFFNAWMFSKADEDGVEEAFFDRKLYAEDNVGNGFQIEDVQQILSENIQKDTNKPSFAIQFAGRNISGTMIDNSHTFTLKIMDCSSQININSKATFLGDMLNHLSKAVALRTPYINEKGNDGIGPLKGLGEIIVAQRPAGGYVDKNQIIGISDGTVTITEDDFSYVEDLLTIFPSVEQMKKNPKFSQVVFANLGDEKNYKKQQRSPININTASWPVLFSIFFNLRAADMSNEPVRAISRLIDRIRFLEQRIAQLKLQEGIDNILSLPLLDSILQPVFRILTNLTAELDIAKEQLQKFEKILLDQGEEPIFYTISEEEAITLANRICSRRRAKPFENWQDFEDFLNAQENIPIFEKNRRQKISMIKANCDSSVSLDRLNPDSAAYHFVSKPELLYHTTELTFHPLGCFEITSLAEIFDISGEIISSAKILAEVDVFKVVTEDTQRDFVTNQQQNFDEKIANNAFVLGNNLQNASADPESPSVFEGAVNATAFSLATGYDPIDKPKEIQQGGTELPGKGGNYLFRADFNGSLDANKGNQTQAQGTKEDAVSNGGLALPNEENGSGVFSDLVVDGVILNLEDDNIEDALFYISRPNENAAFDNPSVDGNFPALAEGVDIASLDGDVNQGSLMFWIKINENWNSEVWRTLFFINTSFKIKNEETNEEYTMGIQREVQVRVQKQENGTSQRKVAIQVRNKFFCLVDGKPTKPPANFMPYNNIDFGRRIELDIAQNTGVNAQEFYHVAIRWRNGTSMEGFPRNNPLGINDRNVSIAVSGNFFGENDVKNKSHIVYDQGLPFEGLENTVDRNSFNAFSKDKDFIPLDDRFTELNRFYVGCAGRTLSPEATVDDVRITKNTDWTNQPEFRPSRHQKPTNAQPFDVATFVGQFEVQEQVRPLFAVPTVLTPTSENQKHSVDFTFDQNTLQYTAKFNVQQDEPAPVNVNSILLSASLFYFDKPIFHKYIEE